MRNVADWQKYCVELELYEISSNPFQISIIYTARSIFDAIHSNLFDLYADKFSLIEERWLIVQRDGWGKNDRFFKIYRESTFNQWQDDVLRFEKDILFLEVVTRYKLGRRVFEITLQAGLTRAAVPTDADPNPRPARNERDIDVQIPTDFFLKLNQEEFSDDIGKICEKNNTTYAVIDYIGSATGSYMQFFAFERFGLHTPSKGMQKKIPSIAWWQYITPPLCEDTGTLETVFNNYNCFNKKLYGITNTIGLSIQLSDRIENLSNELKLGFRTYFKDSLPDFSLEELAKAYKYDINDILMLIPLYNDEVNKVELLRQSNVK
ncbi:MAG: hypothetical protein IJJ23_06350 [Clostridia bacterium]|nr:hypothetical protein [Clostridia bacterium]